jgi:hypothetical protein
MEGAIGERLKREYNIIFDDWVALAGLIYNTESRQAILKIFGEYVTVAEKYHLPLLRQLQLGEQIKNLYH